MAWSNQRWADPNDADDLQHIQQHLLRMYCSHRGSQALSLPQIISTLTDLASKKQDGTRKISVKVKVQSKDQHICDAKPTKCKPHHNASRRKQTVQHNADEISKIRLASSQAFGLDQPNFFQSNLTIPFVRLQQGSVPHGGLISSQQALSHIANHRFISPS
jgi:hypothetical protein